MLRLFIGRAGTGKTAAVMGELHRAVLEKKGHRLLIVPEQYSHEAERELCRACGDSMSLYAEVMSFTGLARRVASQQGGGAAAYLDKGGRLLCMALALDGTASRLRMYGTAGRKAETQSALLAAVDSLKAAGVDSEKLYAASENCPGGLGDKLADMALILEAYDAVVANGHADPADRLNVLAGQIDEGGMSAEDCVYVDGFIDFTFQERQVLHSLLKRGVDLTVCLTLDELHGDSEIFELSRRSAHELLAYAKEMGAETELRRFEADPTGNALDFFAENMFSYSAVKFQGELNGAVDLVTADGVVSECEFAAARAIALVRDNGCRWRDIAVAVRGFDSYRAALESTFEHYGVPLFMTRRSDLLSKPLPAMISAAYDIVCGGWEVDDVISYMRTGLTGLAVEDCDMLENYIFKWQLRAGAWSREGDWRQHPDGYNAEYTDETAERLKKINALRHALGDPLLHFAGRGRAASTAEQQAAALADFFDELGLAERLSERAGQLMAAGREELAREYAQLWDIIVSALEQCAAILGDTETDMESFGRLFTLMLSRYDVGVIPVSLDRVSAGDFDRMRRRNIKHLIVLGVSDERLPSAEGDTGIFSDEERRRLLELDIDLGGAGDGELWREFSLIYNCLSLPSESLTLCYPLIDPEGAAQRPSFVYSRAAAIFGIQPRHADISELRTSAPAPALTLAAHAVSGGSVRERSAAEYFRRSDPERFAKLTAAAKMSRGRLSPDAVRALYGRRLRLSASRIDKFASCKFAYFCQYGLNARPYEPAGFTPPEVGTFMHYVLEHTAREVRERGGFGAVSDEELKDITQRHVDGYAHERLNDFREKSERFIYLFRRLSRDAYRIVLDMAQELRRSDFEPLDFELDFANMSDMPPVELGEGEGSVTLTGIADRVDGWLHDGRLYLRVVDYKTGKKTFSLSDVWYGMGLQMLLYLFTLGEEGARLYGHEIVPAGVMYVPARSAILPVPRDCGEEQAQKLRLENVRRSGVVLDEQELIEAWEHGDDKKYIPIRIRYNKPTADSLMSAERLGLLSRHIRKTLADMARQLNSGSIAADPFYRSQQENACLNCDYFDACHFSQGENGESCRFMQRIPAEKVIAMMENEDGEEGGNG